MPSLYELLSPDVVVITPNQRLAQNLIEQWVAQQKKVVTNYPNCYPFSIWLRNTFKKIIEHTPESSHPILIDDLVAIRVWYKLIETQPHTNASITLPERLYQSWCQCQAYRCIIDETRFNHNHQTQWFAKLAQRFETCLNDARLVVESQLIEYVCKYSKEVTDKKLIFACFDQFTPQQQFLFTTLVSQGAQIKIHDVDRKPAANVTKAALADAKQEKQAWLDWLINKYQSGKQSIALILPNLQKCAPDIHRKMLYHFKPDEFNISMGQSLLDFPMISQALVLLQPAKKMLSSHDIQIFLTSPFIKGSQIEWLNRTLLLENNRQFKQATVPNKLWVSQIEKNSPILHKLFQSIPLYPDIALPSQWANYFIQRLHHFRFPGDYGLTSTMYQCYEKWRSVLIHFAQLDRVESQIKVNEALELLKILLSRTIFQPQTTKKAPIQILGMLEASGCEFDALWMAELTDQTLPTTGQLTPFIPIPIQQQLEMPYASKAKEYQISEKQLNRFRQSCDEFVVSFAYLSDDKLNLPSPLIAQCPDITVSERTQNMAIKHALQTYNDPEHLPLEADENIRGGTRILANQAQCPFKAFAANRLVIQESDKAVDGLDSREKGTLIHLILQTIWQKIEDKDKLNSFTTEELTQLVNETINICVPKIFVHNQTDFEKSILTLEKHKLTKLIIDVLEEDKKRPPFRMVAAEQSCQYDFENFSIQLKFDRLDTINEDKSKWIIDYKSTIPSGSPWLDDRPDDPQILLYALLDEDIRTISYMQIQTGGIKHRGFAESPSTINGITSAKKKPWADYRIQWRSAVSKLANEFSQGIIRPHPKKSSICQTCCYGQFCRYPLQTRES